MMPRSDGIALGGTSERGIWDTTPDEDARQRIVTGHIELFSAMQRSGSGARGRLIFQIVTSRHVEREGHRPRHPPRAHAVVAVRRPS
jgi:hypothetical protein